MQGKWFCCAISCARRCFFTVIGKYVPPLTVASFATTTDWRRDPRPTRVTIPAAGTWLSYMSQAASCDNSRKGEPMSSSWRTRSRGSSLPRPTCFSRAVSPPPLPTRPIFSRRSDTRAVIASRPALNSGERGLSLVWIAVIASPAPVLQPAIAAFQTVEAPERFTVDDDVRRAEHAALNGGFGFDLELFLHHRVGDDIENLLPVHAYGRSDIGRDLGTGDIAVVDHVGAIQRKRDLFLSGRALRFERIDDPSRRLTRNRKLAWQSERDFEQPRRALHVGAAVGTLHRRPRQRQP